LHSGDQVTATNQQRIVVAIADDAASFTVDRPFNPPLPANTPFTYQTPIIRLDDSTRQPQTLLNAAGNLGVGSLAPDAKLTVQDSISLARPAATTAALHIKNTEIASLFYVQNDGRVGIGTATPDTPLHINGALKISTTNAAVQVEPHNNQVNITTTTNGYTIDKRLTLESGLTVNTSGVTVASGDVIVNTGQITAGALTLKSTTPQISLSTSDKARITLSPSGNVGIGTLTPQSSLDVAGSTTIGFNLAGKTPAPLNGLLIEGDVGIGISPDSAKLHVDGGAFKVSHDNAFINVLPTTDAIDFTTSAGSLTGYRFDQSITITSGGLTIAAGGATLNGTVGIHADTDGSGGTLTVARGITVGAGGIAVADGDLTIAGSLKSSTSTLALGTRGGTAIALSADNVRIGGAASSSPTPKLEVIAPASFTSNEPIFQVSKSGNASLFAVKNNGEITLGNTSSTSVSGTLKLLGSGANLSLGTEQAEAALHIQGGIFTGGGTLVSDASNKRQIKRSDGANFTGLRPGDIIIPGDSPANARVITSIPNSSTLEVNEPFVTDLKDASFQTGAIARFTTASGKPQLFFTATPDTMILGVTPTTNLFLMAKQILASGEWRVTGPTLQVSSRKLKQNISKLSSQEANLLLSDINPVKFTYKADQTNNPHLGFIAEELPEAVVSSDRQAVDLMEIVAVLTKMVKDQQQTINSLVKVAQEQQQAIATLQARF
jgi:hypothetical protein